MANRRILILDDEAAVGQTIQWIAESLGFDAEFVTHSGEFFDRLEDMCPDIVTIDLVMPELDGVEVMRLLAERKSRASIIISSGMGTRVLDAAQRSALEHGLSIAGSFPSRFQRRLYVHLSGKKASTVSGFRQRRNLRAMNLKLRSRTCEARSIATNS